MPTLDWIGKKAVINHDKEVPFHLLKCDKKFSVGDPGSGNLLVEGDNLVALKALLPYYAGQVKCIYIDPPYNTGNEGWIYNDNVNSPEIRQWLGNIVGPEMEDLSRHDKWLCMMYPRMKLLRQFLRNDGAIFVSIDDNEVHTLRSLMDEIFGANNFIASIVWQKRTSPDARLRLSNAHDYIVVYAKQKAELRLNKLPLSESRSHDYKNPDNDPRGPWASVDLTGQTGHATPDQFYTVTTPTGRVLPPPSGRCWGLAERTFLELQADNRIWFGTSGSAKPRLKKFLSESDGVPSWTWWPNIDVGHNQEATKELKDLMGESDLFDNPKPTKLIKRIIQLASDPDSFILDAFAGSGTTAHAVLELNRETRGQRRVLTIEMNQSISRNVTARRIRKIIERLEDAEDLAKLGFRFCTLGFPLLDASGKLHDTVRFRDLAAHVYFCETGEPIAKTANSNTPLLGIHNKRAIYLLYNGILGDKTINGGNVLTRVVLDTLPSHIGPKVIYGNGCRLGRERLKRDQITFRQIPYEIRVG